ncbi:Hypothetical_protein [Hexamita inflata]|uniref:Hypothetical_protein n=1 Tax=Hexamita inflata TaxID=28002 RepID=A0AA86R4P4_9EUKA|nr:Hypothetical protein HINF_LOCUS53454 [Hexamita inflata]
MKHVVTSDIIQLLKLTANMLQIRVNDNVSENLQQEQNKNLCNLCMNYDADLMFRRDQWCLYGFCHQDSKNHKTNQGAFLRLFALKKTQKDALPLRLLGNSTKDIIILRHWLRLF